MKKYTLSIRVRKNLEEREIQTEELDTTHFVESIRLKEFALFDKDAYLTFSLTEKEDDKDVPA